MATKKQQPKNTTSYFKGAVKGRYVSTSVEGIVPAKIVRKGPVKAPAPAPIVIAEPAAAEPKKIDPNDYPIGYVSPLAASMHESMADLYELGLVDKATMREFDDSCLTPVPTFGAKEIKALREREQASQAVLARHLGVSLNAVGQWERGERKASGAAAKLLALVKAHGLGHIR